MISPKIIGWKRFKMKFNTEGLTPAMPFLGGNGQRITGSISIDGVGRMEGLQSEALEVIRFAVARAFTSSTSNDGEDSLLPY